MPYVNKAVNNALSAAPRFAHNVVMLSTNHRSIRVAVALLAAAAIPAFAQSDFKAAALKHLKTSKEFTLKVANQMPDASYDFKLTPPQMSFADQMVHLSQAMEFFVSPIYGEKGNPAKPASMKKADIIAFMGKSFDHAIERVSKLTPEQLSKTYTSGEGTMTGMEMLMGLLDHTTHHRASAEMYLRAKGITPAEYQF
jgi:uncharacterized damage-inducible protein DinB